MHFMHHAMKMDALFCAEPQRFEKQVHQKRLATTYASIYIESAHRILSPAEQLLYDSLRRCIALFKFVLQGFETLDQRLLCGVTDVAFSSQAVFPGFANSQN